MKPWQLWLKDFLANQTAEFLQLFLMQPPRRFFLWLQFLKSQDEVLLQAVLEKVRQQSNFELVSIPPHRQIPWAAFEDVSEMLSAIEVGLNPADSEKLAFELLLEVAVAVYGSAVIPSPISWLTEPLRLRYAAGRLNADSALLHQFVEWQASMPDPCLWMPGASLSLKSEPVDLTPMADLDSIPIELFEVLIFRLSFELAAQQIEVYEGVLKESGEAVLFFHGAYEDYILRMHWLMNGRLQEVETRFFNRCATLLLPESDSRICLALQLLDATAGKSLHQFLLVL